MNHAALPPTNGGRGHGRRRVAGRRDSDSLIRAILNGDCEDESWEVEPDPNQPALRPKKCGKCLTCRTHAALKEAAVLRWLTIEFARRGERRTIDRRRNHVPHTIAGAERSRRSRPDRRRHA